MVSFPLSPRDPFYRETIRQVSISLETHGAENDLAFPYGNTTRHQVDVVRSFGLYSEILSPFHLTVVLYSFPTTMKMNPASFVAKRTHYEVHDTGFVFFRFQTPMAGVLPYGAPIKCLIGYYDPSEPVLSNQAKRPYPSFTKEDKTGSHVPYRTLLRMSLGTHQ